MGVTAKPDINIRYLFAMGMQYIANAIATRRATQPLVGLGNTRIGRQCRPAINKRHKFDQHIAVGIISGDPVVHGRPRALRIKTLAIRNAIQVKAALVVTGGDIGIQLAFVFQWLVFIDFDALHHVGMNRAQFG